MKRVIAYIDGFNLYFGLKHSGMRRFYWLDVARLAENLLLPDHRLANAKYFTARIPGPSEKSNRQKMYLEALMTRPEVAIYYGKFQLDPRRCPHCKKEDFVPHEKMTDVQIAVQLLSDAHADRFDTAFLISADGDLAPPVQAVREAFREKRVVAVFPPGRSSFELKRVADAQISIRRSHLAKSRLPDRITKADGFELVCPLHWTG